MEGADKRRQKNEIQDDVDLLHYQCVTVHVRYDEKRKNLFLCSGG